MTSSEDLDAVDRLLEKVPRIRCGNCGIDDPNELSLVYDTSMILPVVRLEQGKKYVITEGRGEDSGRYQNSRLLCSVCQKETPLPKQWAWK